MRVGRLLNQTVYVLPFDQSGADEYGNPAETWGPPVEHAPGGPRGGARLEQTDAEERTSGRDVQMGDWLLMLHADAEVGGRDRVEADGQTFQVIGPPQVMRDVRGRPHHIEAQLQHIEF